ncbi:uncharacterized protein LOC129749765 [Uranotaenia lowii]|uniref:uncharacterized protein LOC129749765 n=1 Tax=Uranotaenia lowii TaxID=190385 RepID=UPI0024799A2C|nr:uncharacterized protein LOC129749765 [Uranotaenia lowii]
MHCASTPDFERLETSKFSIRSLRKRQTKCVQQELIRAIDRRRSLSKRRRHKPYDKTWSPLSPLKRSIGRASGLSHEYLPRCDPVTRKAVELYLVSKSQALKMPLESLKSNKPLMIATINGFFEQPDSVRQKFIEVAVLSDATRNGPCSDPFQIFFDLHRKQSRIERFLNSSEGRDVDIGVFAMNLERAEAGEEADPTRLTLITRKRFVEECEQLWKNMTPEQKFPFFAQAFIGTHFPQELDQALQ